MRIDIKILIKLLPLLILLLLFINASAKMDENQGLLERQDGVNDCKYIKYPEHKKCIDGAADTGFHLAKNCYCTQETCKDPYPEVKEINDSTYSDLNIAEYHLSWCMSFSEKCNNDKNWENCFWKKNSIKEKIYSRELKNRLRCTFFLVFIALLFVILVKIFIDKKKNKKLKEFIKSAGSEKRKILIFSATIWIGLIFGLTFFVNVAQIQSDILGTSELSSRMQFMHIMDRAMKLSIIFRYSLQILTLAILCLILSLIFEKWGVETIEHLFLGAYFLGVILTIVLILSNWTWTRDQAMLVFGAISFGILLTLITHPDWIQKIMKKKKVKMGILFGIFIGIISVILMTLKDLPWGANISAFLLWVVSGIIISTSNLKINGVVKGIVISLLVLAPTAVLIGWQEPISLIPIFIMTSTLGGLLGCLIERFGK